MKKSVRPKKFLGQHFLCDNNIARKIVNSLTTFGKYEQVLEVGPGTGVLTKFLLKGNFAWKGVELDRDSIAYLRDEFAEIGDNLLEDDFLKIDLEKVSGAKPMAIIGNFPYNISSQIVFKVLESSHLVPELVGMFQKEVAMRIAASPGNKTYGILSVLTQAFYHVEILFVVGEHVFDPPPKVKSAVIRMTRKEESLPVSPNKLRVVVKTAFNQRRKTLKNSLRCLDINWDALPADFQSLRPERLTLEDFFVIAKNCN